MADVEDLITAALTKLGVIEQGGAPNASEAARALSVLNDEVVTTLKADPLMAYAAPVVQKVLSAGTQAYTIGAGGDIDVPRPVFINGGAILTGGLRLPLEYTTDPARWRQIVEHHQAVLPTLLFDDGDFPTRKLKLHPTPSGTPTLELYPYVTVEPFAALNTTVAVPNGYWAVLVNQLAVSLSGEYGMAVPPSVTQDLGTAANLVRAANGAMMGVKIPQQQGA